VVVTVLARMTDETYVRKMILENHIEHAIGIDAAVAGRMSKTWDAYRKIGRSTLFLVDRKGIVTDEANGDELKLRIEKALGN